MSERQTKTAADGQRRQAGEDNARQRQGSVLDNGGQTVAPALPALLRYASEHPEASALRPLVARQLLALQASHGNQYVQRLVKGTLVTARDTDQRGKTDQANERQGVARDPREPIARTLKVTPKDESQVQRQLLQRAPTPGPSKRAQRIFNWLEKPLQAAVKKPKKIDRIKRKGGVEWNDDAISGLVLIYNKMRNEDVWQYVEEIKDTYPEITVNFSPKGGPAALRKRLAKHGYVDCMSSYGADWGLREEGACGAHLHFKHIGSGDQWVNVHIDKHDPCCDLVGAIRHLLSDYRKAAWARRNPDEFLRLLKKQGVPLSTGTLDYLKRKGYVIRIPSWAR